MVTLLLIAEILVCTGVEENIFSSSCSLEKVSPQPRCMPVGKKREFFRTARVGQPIHPLWVLLGLSMSLLPTCWHTVVVCSVQIFTTGVMAT